MAWNSSTPRRSGAFVVEVLERAPRMNLMTSKRLVSWPSISLGTAGAVGAGNMDTLTGIGAINTDSFVSRERGLERRNSKVGNELHSSSGTADGRNACKDHSVLHLGDTFRLRSVKFPDYELGITSERVRGDFCYLGLRKVNDLEKDTWCVPLRFNLKAPASEIFTSRDRSKTQSVQPVTH